MPMKPLNLKESLKKTVEAVRKQQESKKPDQTRKPVAPA